MLEYEWDETKRAANLRKHGIDFSFCNVIFERGPSVTTDTHFSAEPRFMTIGMLDGKCCTIIWTPRNAHLRIISIRRSRHDEEAHYRSVHQR